VGKGGFEVVLANLSSNYQHEIMIRNFNLDDERMLEKVMQACFALEFLSRVNSGYVAG
jgi:hypothetical protein